MWTTSFIYRIIWCIYRGNLYYISRGMQQHEALFMVTVYMGANITTNSLSAIVVLGEMDDAPWWKLAGYTFCILMMMAGTVPLKSLLPEFLKLFSPWPLFWIFFAHLGNSMKTVQLQLVGKQNLTLTPRPICSLLGWHGIADLGREGPKQTHHVNFPGTIILKRYTVWFYNILQHLNTKRYVFIYLIDFTSIWTVNHWISKQTSG